jgi:hypothetical protein
MKEIYAGLATVRYVSTHIGKGMRGVYVLLSLLLLAMGGHNLLLLARASRLGLVGAPQWIACAGMLCAGATLIVVLVDQVDRRDAETDYRRFARVTQTAGWCLFVAALAAEAVVRRGTLL